MPGAACAASAACRRRIFACAAAIHPARPATNASTAARGARGGALTATLPSPRTRRFKFLTRLRVSSYSTPPALRMLHCRKPIRSPPLCFGFFVCFPVLPKSAARDRPPLRPARAQGRMRALFGQQNNRAAVILPCFSCERGTQSKSNKKFIQTLAFILCSLILTPTISGCHNE